MIDKAESRAIRLKIHEVLLNVWDPIGIKDEPNAQGEYDGYIGEIYGLLTRGASDAEIHDRLKYIMTERMGLEGGQRKSGQASAKPSRRYARFSSEGTPSGQRKLVTSADKMTSRATLD